ncbi:hypothetical protein AGMMS50256_39440 [Betaproteobacteria bacterium]|nr:hypothetical protein AGMMS50256_39440 [Betaproteobacteria bacterium]
MSNPIRFTVPRRYAQALLLSIATLLPQSAVAQTGATFTNSIGTEFILIPAGSFTMGADKNSEKAEDDETPPHRVSISQETIVVCPIQFVPNCSRAESTLSG